MNARQLVASWAISSLLLAGACMAAPPVLQPGTCTYLVGAPPGAVLAGSEERFDGSAVEEVCNETPTFGARQFGDNSVQAHLLWPGGAGSRHCRVETWVGHRFTVGGSGGPIRARIDISGFVDGVMGVAIAGNMTSMTIDAVVAELDDLLSTEQVIRRAPLLHRQLETGAAQLNVSSAIDEAVDVTVVPGRTYSVELVLMGHMPSSAHTFDFGPPGTGEGVRYDSIEVCIDPPASDPRLDAIADLDLEERLYHRDCFPGIWMPEANGGQLESARQLVVQRIAQAAATGDPNVNARQAQIRVLMANAAMNARQYQRACKNLSDALRTLTTP